MKKTLENLTHIRTTMVLKLKMRLHTYNFAIIVVLNLEHLPANIAAEAAITMSKN